MKIYNFTQSTGIQPFVVWLCKIKDTRAKIRIEKRIRRIEEDSNLGDYNYVGEGVYELRYHFGPGYRVYFAFENHDIMFLLGGGDKSSQQKDIKNAQKLWKEYIRHGGNNGKA